MPGVEEEQLLRLRPDVLHETCRDAGARAAAARVLRLWAWQMQLARTWVGGGGNLAIKCCTCSTLQGTTGTAFLLRLLATGKDSAYSYRKLPWRGLKPGTYDKIPGRGARTSATASES